MDPARPEAAPLHRQVRYLDDALQQNPVAQAVLATAAELDVPDWYFGAGGVAQTVWNLRHGFEPTVGIKDYDLVYFDPTDLSADAEQQIEHEAARRLSDLDVVVDVKNEARVHLWYAERFGRLLEPYRSTEEAIATWPTTASSVGVRQDGDGFVVCAPFGLADLLGMVARPNKAIVTRDVYEEKVARWAVRWPELRVSSSWLAGAERRGQPSERSHLTAEAVRPVRTKNRPGPIGARPVRVPTSGLATSSRPCRPCRPCRRHPWPRRQLRQRPGRASPACRPPAPRW